MENYLSDSKWDDNDYIDDYEELNIKRQERRIARHKQEQRYIASIAMMSN